MAMSEAEMHAEALEYTVSTLPRLSALLVALNRDNAAHTVLSAQVEVLASLRPSRRRGARAKKARPAGV
jgi:hypothetical protein